MGYYYVWQTRVLPTGERIRCRVCRSTERLLYHNTSRESLKPLLRDNVLSSFKCGAQVLSFSRRKDQSHGGPVKLTFKESSLPNKTEACYADEYDTRKVNAREFIGPIIRRHAHRRHVDDDYRAAVMGVFSSDYQNECEVSVRGCVPLNHVLRVDYDGIRWLTEGIESRAFRRVVDFVWRLNQLDNRLVHEIPLYHNGRRVRNLRQYAMSSAWDRND